MLAGKGHLHRKLSRSTSQMRPTGAGTCRQLHDDSGDGSDSRSFRFLRPHPALGTGGSEIQQPPRGSLTFPSSLVSRVPMFRAATSRAGSSRWKIVSLQASWSCRPPSVHFNYNPLSFLAAQQYVSRAWAARSALQRDSRAYSGSEPLFLHQ